MSFITHCFRDRKGIPTWCDFNEHTGFSSGTFELNDFNQFKRFEENRCDVANFEEKVEAFKHE